MIIANDALGFGPARYLWPSDNPHGRNQSRMMAKAPSLRPFRLLTVFKSRMTVAPH
jgi:hypothetical protein